MFFLRIPNIPGWLMCVSLISQIGCNTGNFAGFQGKAIKKSSQSSGDGVNYQSTSQDINYSAMSFDDTKSLQMSDFYQKSLEVATDDSMIVRGHSFSDISSILEAHEEDFLKITEEFLTVGEYFESLGISSESDILAENVDVGFSIVSDLIGSGWFQGRGKTSSESSSAANSKSASEAKESGGSMKDQEASAEVLKHSLIVLAGLSFHGGQVSLYLQGGDQGRPAAEAAGQALADSNKPLIEVSEATPAEIAGHVGPIPVATIIGQPPAPPGA